VRITRLRQRQAYYVTRIRDSERFAAERQNRASAWERTLHVRKRAAQIQRLIAELDRLFFLSLGLRENQLVRQTVWSNRWGAWSRHKPYGHGRGRFMDVFDVQ
jgi:hypothetical protein